MVEPVGDLYCLTIVLFNLLLTSIACSVFVNILLPGTVCTTFYRTLLLGLLQLRLSAVYFRS
ncbi:hypothetical protein DPMN_034790 [Dreissena polymorpha]|uniref:Uncharacterized protein n=1 Tax=Dreissena polymorpha TaxID=45954 RepID=A0A9D4M8B2_DREPO|nr:hypothetical protein DPMN_034790 [Dreissena polymorpha]